MSQKIRYTKSFGLGSTKSENRTLHNHFASSEELAPEVKSKIASLGLTRVAGNIYVQASSDLELPANRDFWKLSGGKIIKLVGSECDLGESLHLGSDDDEDGGFSLNAFLDVDFN